MTTRDEVLAMAEQAGGKLLEGVALYVGRYHISTQFLERFAALAFEAGRKAAEQDMVDAERWRMAKSLAVVRKSGRKLYKTDDPIPSYRLIKNADVGVIKPEINEEYEVCLFACIGETSIPEMDALMDNAIDRARSAK